MFGSHFRWLSAGAAGGSSSQKRDSVSSPMASSICSMFSAFSFSATTSTSNHANFICSSTSTKFSSVSPSGFCSKHSLLLPRTKFSFQCRTPRLSIAMAGGSEQLADPEEEEAEEGKGEGEDAEEEESLEGSDPVSSTSTVYFGKKRPETELEIAAAYEALYGPAYSGISVLGNDVDAVDKNKEKKGFRLTRKTDKIKDGFEERVVQVRRVTKVVKGGKQLSFRAVVVVGDKNGKVGVGVAKAKEVITAVQKSAVDARRHVVTVPMTKYLTFPHRADGHYGAAKVMLRPATAGTGVIAGGAVRVVLELAGVENALGKQLGSDNPLNNARAVIDAVSQMRQFSEVAAYRGIPMEELWK